MGNESSPSRPIGEAEQQRPGAETWLHSAWPVIRVILALTPLIPVIVILWLIWNRTPLIAWWDEWYQFGPLIQALHSGTLNFDQIWAPAAEHRLVIPRIVGLVIIETTGWDRQIQMTIYLLLGLVTLILVIDAVRRTFGSANAAIALAGPLALMMLSLTQFENWLWPLGFGYIVTGFSAALCLWALSSHTGWVGLLLAMGGVLIASLSTAAGTVMWIAFLPAVWLLGRRYFTIWVVAAIGVMTLYFSQGSQSSLLSGGSGEPAETIRSVRYMAAFLMAPISRDHFSMSLATVLIGGILLLVSTIVLSQLGVASATLWSWLGMAAFAAGCAIMLGLGRARLSHEVWIPSRYDAFSALWWVAIVSLAALSTLQLWQVHRKPSSKFTGRPAQVLIGVNLTAIAALVVALVTANIQGFQQGYAWMDFPIQQQQCVIAPKYASDFCLSIFNSQPKLARSQILDAEARQLGIFRGRTPIDVAQFRRLPDPAVGTIDAINRRPVGPLLAPDASALASGTPTAAQPTTTKDRPKKGKRNRQEKGDTNQAKSGRETDKSTKTELVVPAGQYIPVSGWAMADAGRELAGGVVVVVDDSEYIWSAYGQKRIEPVGVDGAPPSTESGFITFVSPEVLPIGKHSLRLMVLTPDLEAYAFAPQVVTIDVQDLPSLDVARLHPLEQMAYGGIEQMNGRVLPNQQHWPDVESANEPLEIVGWAYDPLAVTSARRAFLLVDGQLTLPVQVGLPRGEVAMGLHHPPITYGIDFALVGYKAVIPPGTLAPGSHTLEVRIVTQNERSYYAANPTLTIRVDLE